MKKIAALLVSALFLFSFASCENGGKTGTSSTASLTASDVQSGASTHASEDSASDVSSANGEETVYNMTYSEFYAAMPSMDLYRRISLKMDMTTGVSMMGSNVTTKTEGVMQYRESDEGTKAYQSIVMKSILGNMKFEEYYADGRYYTISDGDGFYYNMTEEEAKEYFMGTEAESGLEMAHGSALLFESTDIFTEDMFKLAKVSKVGDDTIVKFELDSQSDAIAMQTLMEFLEMSPEDMEYVKFDSFVTEYVLDGSGNFKSMHIGMSFSADDPDLGSQEITADFNITVVAYGDDVVVTEPADLSKYPSLPDDWD